MFLLCFQAGISNNGVLAILKSEGSFANRENAVMNIYILKNFTKT